MSNQYQEFPVIATGSHVPPIHHNPHNMQHVDPRFIPVQNPYGGIPPGQYGGGGSSSDVMVSAKYASVASDVNHNNLAGTYGMDQYNEPVNYVPETNYSEPHYSNSFHETERCIEPTNTVIPYTTAVTNEYLKPKIRKYVQQSTDLFNIIKHLDSMPKNIQDFTIDNNIVFVDEVIYSKEKLVTGYLTSLTLSLGKIFDGSILITSIPVEFDDLLTTIFNNSFKFDIDSFIGDIGDVHNLIKGSLDSYTEAMLVFKNSVNDFVDSLKVTKPNETYEYIFKRKINILTNNIPELEGTLKNVNHIFTPIPKKSILKRQIVMIKNGGDIVLHFKENTYLIKSNSISIIKGL